MCNRTRGVQRPSISKRLRSSDTRRTLAAIFSYHLFGVRINITRPFTRGFKWRRCDVAFRAAFTVALQQRLTHAKAYERFSFLEMAQKSGTGMVPATRGIHSRGSKYARAGKEST